MQTSRRFRGFTLIELLAVVAIIGILATLAIIGITNATRRARDSRRQSDIVAVKQALLLYSNDTGEFVVGSKYSDLEAALVPNYIAKLPVDPRNTSKLVYSYAGNATDFALKAQMEYKGHKQSVTGVSCTSALALDATSKGNGITSTEGGDKGAPCYRVTND